MLTTRATPGRLLACAAVPLLTVAGMWVAHQRVAPLWAGGSTDPSYGYLLNSLLAAELRVPVKTDHPGIPLHVLGALTLRARQALAGGGLSLRDHVLTDPEPFLAAIVFVLLLVWAAASFFLGWAAWRLTGRWALVAVAQASPFVCFEVLRSGTQVMCEPLLLAGAMTLSGLLLSTLQPERADQPRPLATAMGVVVALGAATKVVFAPALIPALASARSRGARTRVVIVAGFVFGACLLLIAPRLPATAMWMWQLLARSGYHGVGETTVVDPGRYLGGLVRLLRAELPLHAAFVTALGVCVWPRPPRGFHPSARRYALALFAAWAVTLVVAAKQPQAHYLVTVAGLLPALVVLASWRLQLAGRGRPEWIAAAALGLALVAGTVHAIRGARWLFAIRSEAKAGANAVARAVAGRETAVLYGHRVSTVPAALASGDEWTDLLFAADLRRLHPGFVAFDCEGLQAFGEDVSPREIVRRVRPDGTVLLQDARWRSLGDCPWTAALPRRTVATGGRDALHEVLLLAPDPPLADGGPWVGGMLVVAGLDSSPGPQRWAIGRRTSLVFDRTAGPVTLEIAAGHGLPGDQALTIFANGTQVHGARLPRLPATAAFTVAIDALAGWNEIEIAYDAVTPVAATQETPVPGLRTRAREAVSPAVRFDTLRLVRPGVP